MFWGASIMSAVIRITCKGGLGSMRGSKGLEGPGDPGGPGGPGVWKVMEVWDIRKEAVSVNGKKHSRSLEFGCPACSNFVLINFLASLWNAYRRYLNIRLLESLQETTYR